jgi:asparagine synthase (glutamine-hydrolysing)
MKVQVAIAMSYVASAAADAGFKVLLTGQGADELFAGYAKFTKTFDSMGPEAAKDAVIKSVCDAHMTNYARDEQVSSPYRIKLRHPFADWRLTEIALSVPITENLCFGDDPLRKRVLRKMGRLAGVPSFIVESRKRAIQYGSGIQKALTEVGNRRNLKLRALLDEEYRHLSWDRLPVL